MSVQIAEDWRTIALDLYIKHDGTRCIWCFLNIDDPLQRTLVVRDGQYFLFHKDCVEQAVSL